MQTNHNLSKTRIARGEIFYVVPMGNEITEGQFTGGRPAIIVSNDMNNELNGIVEVVYLTRQEHCKYDLPTNVLVRSTGIASLALCNQIYTVAKKRIGKYICECTENEMSGIETAMGLSLCTTDIFSSKKLSSAIALWKENLSSSKVMDEIADITEPAPDGIKGSSSDVLDVLLEKKTDAALPFIEQDITTHPAFIRMQAERDLLKNMHDELAEKVIYYANKAGKE